MEDSSLMIEVKVNRRSLRADERREETVFIPVHKKKVGRNRKKTITREQVKETQAIVSRLLHDLFHLSQNHFFGAYTPSRHRQNIFSSFEPVEQVAGPGYRSNFRMFPVKALLSIFSGESLRSKKMKFVRLAVLTTCAVFLAGFSADVYGQTSSGDSLNGAVKVACGNPNCAVQAPCGAHGCPNCAGVRTPWLREALTPAEQPYLGMQPLFIPRNAAYAYGYAAYPVQPRFPRLRAALVPQQQFNSTRPVPPMKTYTTRGPRDFLNPNPPSIGY